MRILKYIIRALFIALIMQTALSARGTLVFGKKLEGSTTRDTGEVVTYTLKSSCNSLTGNCGDLTITDTAPDGMEVMDCVVPNGFTVNKCDTASGIEIVKDNKFDGGDTFDLQVKMRIKLDAYKLGQPIANTATAVITKPDNGTPSSVDSTAEAINVNNPSKNYSLEKVRVKPTSVIGPALDNPVTYKVSICANKAVGNIDLTNVKLTDAIPAGAVLVENPDNAAENGGNLEWTIGDINLATLYSGKDYNSKQCISKTYSLKYPSGTFSVGDNIINTLSGTDDSGVVGPDVNITEPIVVAQSIPSASKVADDVLPGTTMVWKLSADLHTANAPTPDFVVYDTLPQTPAGLAPTKLKIGEWSSPNTINGASDVQAEVFTATDHAGDCQNATYTSITNGFVAGNLNTEYPLAANTTCIKWVFEDKSTIDTHPDIPVDWEFTTSPEIEMDTSAVQGSYPKDVKNCMQLTHTKSDGTTDSVEKCFTAQIEEATPAIDISKSASPSSDVKPADEVVFTINFKHDKRDSTGPSKNPVVVDVLPPEFEYLGVESISGANSVTPTVTIDGSGNSIIKFDFTGQDFDENSSVDIKIKTKVKDGTVAATYTNKVYYFDNSGRFSCAGNSQLQDDSNDLDGDGSSTDKMCMNQRGVVVISAAVLNGSKWIHGDDSLTPKFIDTTDLTKNDQCPTVTVNGDDYTRFPCVAQTQKRGNFKYLINIKNSGNLNLDHYILYDLLPKKGDTGSGEPLFTQQRGSEWRPRLTGAATVIGCKILNPNDVVIEYSKEDNPCRPEVSASDDITTDWTGGCTDDWNTTLPANPSKVRAIRIKIDNNIVPLDECNITVPMKAPKAAPGSDVTDVNKLHPAWNSFAHRTAYSNNSKLLPTAEPRQVGIVLPKGPEVTIGSLVWADDNNNSQQDSGESGIAGAKVELLFADGTLAYDRDGQPVAPQTTDSSGKYYFNNLEEGNYTVKVTPPPHYVPSTGQNDQNNSDIANDSNIAKDNGDGSYTSGVFEVTKGSEPTGTAESSPITDNGDDADNHNTTTDNSGNMTIDFGFVPPVSVGSTVFYDYDNDGIQDPGEKGIPGVTVKLYASDCSTPIKKPDDPTSNYEVTTNNNGDYIFKNLPQGDYCIGVVPPTWANTSSTPTSSSDDQTDGDDNGIQTGGAGTEVKSPVIHLAPGTEPTDTTGVEKKTGPNDTGKGQDNVDDDAGDMTVDFGFVPKNDPVSIGSNVFYDFNDNGVQDTGELGIEGVTVKLYADVSGTKDGIPDTEVNSTTTDSNGNYYFDGLKSGNYKVCVIPPVDAPVSSHTTDTQDNQQDGDDNGEQANPSDETCSPVINLIPTKEPQNEAKSGGNQDSGADANGDMTVDFGFVPTVSIGSYIWEDTNADGLQDGTDQVIPGVKVKLLKADGSDAVDINGTTVAEITSNDGKYYFDNLPPGTYKVKITLPSADYAPTINQETGDDSGVKEKDSNIGSFEANHKVYYSGNITLTPGSEKVETSSAVGDNADDTPASTLNTHEKSGDMTIDFGFIKTSCIGDKVWHDLDGDGVQDATENNVTEPVTFKLLDENNNTATDAYGNNVAPITTTDGSYMFCKLVPNQNYRVEVVPPAGYVVSPKNKGGDDTADSNFNTDSNRTDVVTVGYDRNNTTVDVGIYRPACIGNRVWLDTDGDGIQDNGENGLANVRVELYKASDNSLVDSMDTNSTGGYEFCGLAPDDYYVKVVKPNGYKLSPQDQSGQATDQDYNNNRDDDSDVNTTTLKTVSVHLSENEKDPTWDIGLYQTACLGNYVWEDKNANGIQDSDESGIEGITVKLYKKDNNGNYVYLDSNDTNSTGGYEFCDLDPGIYMVEVNATDKGYYVTDKEVASAPDNDKDSNIDPDTLRSGDIEIVSHDNNMTIDAGLFKPACIGNYIWLDKDANGIQDDGNSAGVSGVKLRVFSGNSQAVDVNGTTVADQTTGNDGLYHFCGLKPGNYTVKIVDLPEGYYVTRKDVTTTDDEHDSDVDGFRKTKANAPLAMPQEFLSSGEDNNSFDAGVFKPACIGNRIWLDRDADGVQDGNEVNFDKSVTLKLLDANGNLVTQGVNNSFTNTKTVSDGNYEFCNLIPGTYKVKAEIPSGYLFTTPDANGANVDGNDTDTDSDIKLDTNTTVTVTLSSDENDSRWDVGVFEPACLGDYTWLDKNADGIQNNNENPLASVNTVLLDGNGDVVVKDAYGRTISSKDTNSTGGYEYCDLRPGTYMVKFTKAHDANGAPYLSTRKDVGSDDTDSDIAPFTDAVNGLVSNPVTLESGDNNRSIDAGFIQELCLGDKVWEDMNANGIQENGEPAITDLNVTLKMQDANGNWIDATTVQGIHVDANKTDSNGNYKFCHLQPAKTYKVTFASPGNNYYVTDKDANGDNNDTVDSDINASREITVTPVKDDYTLDAGFFRPACIGDYVWLDKNANGIQDNGEDYVNGVTAELFYENGTAVTNVDGSTVTAQTTGSVNGEGNGKYHFCQLKPGKYYVKFTTDDGYYFTRKNTTTDDNDSDIKEQFVHKVGTTPVEMLVSNEDNRTVDAGVFKPACIGDYIWDDKNANGVQDADEVAPKDDNNQTIDINVTIVPQAGAYIKDLDGNILGTKTIENNGTYKFCQLVPGKYQIKVQVPQNWYVTRRDANNSSTSNENNDSADSDMGAFLDTNKTVEMPSEVLSSGENNMTFDGGIFKPSCLGSIVWFDKNANGIKDANEDGIADTNVTLIPVADDYGYVNSINANQVDINSIMKTTGNDGKYEFCNLIPGKYKVHFKFPLVNGAPLITTKNNVGSDNNDSDTPSYNIGEATTDPVTLGSRVNNPTVFAGVIQKICLGDKVWFDENLNGVQDNKEPGVTDVTVHLTYADGSVVKDVYGNEVKLTKTDKNGNYKFCDLYPARDYKIKVDMPTGYNAIPKDKGNDAKDSDVDNAGFILVKNPVVDDYTEDAGIYCNCDDYKVHPENHKKLKASALSIAGLFMMIATIFVVVRRED